MIGAELLWGLLSLILLMDARRIGKRLRALPVLKPDDADAVAEFRWVVAPGVELSAETRSAGLAHLQARGLRALELVPGHLNLKEMHM